MLLKYRPPNIKGIPMIPQILNRPYPEAFRDYQSKPSSSTWSVGRGGNSIGKAPRAAFLLVV